MRVGIIALQHESNTFIGSPTTLEDFRQKALLVGDEIVERFTDGHHEISGFIDALKSARIEIVPIFAALATPGGTLSSDAYAGLLTMLLDRLARAGTLDGLLVAPHGAAVSESHSDMDGHWLSQVRARVGARLPIICTLDPHANVSQRMSDGCDAMIAYRTNPHLDQRARGIEAGELLARTLRREVTPVHSVALPPISINIERQLTSDSPCLDLYALADGIRSAPGVLSVSVILGFPYADVSEMGSGFVVVTDNDPALAKALSGELASYLVTHRHSFDAQLIGIDEAIEQALKAPAPVCLLDMGDNIGGGSTGTEIVLASALHQRRVDRTFVALFDPEAVKRCIVGATVNARVADASVISLHDGKFSETHARHGGMTAYDMGPTAIVRTAHGMTIQLTSRRTPPFSLNQLTSCGIDPKSMRMIIAKGVHAPVAAYAPVCPTFIRVNTPGVTTADMKSLDFRNRRRPMFPFEEIQDDA